MNRHPKADWQRCNCVALFEAPNSFRRCAFHARKLGREGFRDVDRSERLLCDEPIPPEEAKYSSRKPLPIDWPTWIPGERRRNA